MSYLRHEGKEFDMELLSEIGPREYTNRVTGVTYTGPYNWDDYFTPAAIMMMMQCEGCWIQHVSDDTIYIVDIDQNVICYPRQVQPIRAEQLVQMNTFPYAEPDCIAALEYCDKNNIPFDIDFCVCGKYLLIKSHDDIEAFKKLCNELGYPISVEKVDGAYKVTDSNKSST